MTTETYRGSKIRITAGEKPGHVALTINGLPLGEFPGTEASALKAAKERIDEAQDKGKARCEGAAPLMLGHLRPGQGRPAKTGRAARVLTGVFNSLARRRAVLTGYVTRRTLMHYLLAEQAGRHNEALAREGTYTAAIYLRDVLRLPAAHVAKYAGAFGTKAAQAYRAIFGAEPAAFGQCVIGRQRPRLTSCAAYGETARRALEVATGTHKATAVALAAMA